ncbi:MAG: MaoC family dehydratase [Acidimicrobiia bacterium]
MPAIIAKDRFVALAGSDLGASDWFLIDQERVDEFADVTIDHQFIHVDPVKAAATPFGGTIAHGFLTVALLVHLMKDISVVPQGAVMGINYGFDKVRFLTPVKVGSRIRATARVADVAEKSPGQFLVTYDVTVEIEGEAKPALVARWLGMTVVA